MLFDPAIDHDGPPDSKTCMERCGLPGDVKHTALEDAEAVIHMIRFADRQAELSKALRGFFTVDQYYSRSDTVVLVPVRDLQAAGPKAVNAVALMDEIKNARRPEPKPQSRCEPLEFGGQSHPY